MSVVRLRDIHRARRYAKYDINANWNRLARIGYLNNGEEKLGPFENVNNFWYKQDCFVVGSGISGRDFDLNLLNGKHSIGINHMIEYYDNFEWFVFQDLRFLRITKYNINNYKGRIFSSNNTYFNIDKKLNNVCKFLPLGTNHSVTEKIEEGLYCRPLTGLVALNLAICSGASRIFMIGMDMPIEFIENYSDGSDTHYQSDYSGEDKTKKSILNTKNRLTLFKKFTPYYDRIFNVCPNGTMDWFKQISLKEMEVMISE